VNSPTIPRFCSTSRHFIAHHDHRIPDLNGGMHDALTGHARENIEDLRSECFFIKFNRFFESFKVRLGVTA